MSKPQCIQVTITACLMLCLCVGASQAASPNIVLILTDDQGWSQRSEPMDPNVPNSLSTYLETPHMNRLAQEGIRFTSGYSPAAVCTPTRRSILFGTSSVRSGGEFRSAWQPSKHLSLPQAIKQANPAYQCAHFGKWGELMAITPEEAGYDLSHGMTGNGTGGMPGSLGFKRGAEGAPEYIIDNEDPKRTPTITNDAIKFMKANVEAEKPFYVQLSYYATHLTSVTREKTYQKYLKKGVPDRGYSQAWAAMMDDLDFGIGRLLDAVEQLEIRDNTYIFFLADNGGRATTPGGSKDRKPTNFPLNGYKGNLYEGGIRVPFMARGPGITAGSLCRTAVTGYDLFPTFYDLIGGQQNLPEEVDGVSLKPLLDDPENGRLDRPEGAVFFNKASDRMSSIRDGDYKLIVFWTKNDAFEKRELYNLAIDPLEKKNLANKERDRADALQEKLLTFMKKVDAEMPTTAPPRGQREYEKYLKRQKS